MHEKNFYLHVSNYIRCTSTCVLLRYLRSLICDIFYFILLGFFTINVSLSVSQCMIDYLREMTCKYFRALLCSYHAKFHVYYHVNY